ncbi:DUF2397 family protein [Kutzneria sp. NPDC052558]|uniref:DUF2397 family protein n=1 Tax=Kutzneria sp. NPDC052558 TaxID=3364121 RepID=UPI0037C90DD6
MSEAGDAFSVDAFELDDRLRLFTFASVDKRADYLWVLRAFEHARANYVVLLHATDVTTTLAVLADSHPDMPAIAGDVTPLLDQLYGWRVLERSYDGARAATLAEYRNRHYVNQFSQAGYRAYRAVEDVLGFLLQELHVNACPTSWWRETGTTGRRPASSTSAGPGL